MPISPQMNRHDTATDGLSIKAWSTTNTGDSHLGFRGFLFHGWYPSVATMHEQLRLWLEVLVSVIHTTRANNDIAAHFGICDVANVQVRSTVGTKGALEYRA